MPSFMEKMSHQGDAGEDQEKHEADLGDQGRSAGKTAETEKCSDERDDEEDNGVVKRGGC